MLPKGIEDCIKNSSVHQVNILCNSLNEVWSCLTLPEDIFKNVPLLYIYVALAQNISVRDVAVEPRIREF